ncbi:cell agglutination protein Mam3 [Thecaphora frezii]
MSSIRLGTLANRRMTGAGPSLHIHAQPIVKLILILSSSLVHLLAPVLAAPAAMFLGSTDAHGPALGQMGHGGGGDDAPRTDDPVKLAIDILTIAALVILGGIFAGLTLGLMGLDMVNLQVLSTSGSENERKHAAKVMKLLEKGRHWVLVVLLLGNVIVNETLPIFLSDFGGGVAAVLSSTLLIVIFGEIVPQSICARYGLAIGAFCAPMVHATMIILAPIAWPTAKLLDWCLGEEHGTTYRKAELKTFVSLHQQVGTENLNEDEVTIIRAVLDLNDKTVKDVMTPIDDVYIMSSDTVLDEEGVAKLVRSGYSRVPVHEPGRPDAIIGMLLVKNLIQYDPEDAHPVSNFHLTPLPEASPDLTLLDCLNYFQQGRSHMILVSRHPGESRGAMGVVTLEDVIEEMIGEEIVDETDVFVDVHNKIKVVRNPRPSSAGQQSWEPLIRGIIERRRKMGGPMRKPLRSSYGTIGRPEATTSSTSSATGTSTPVGHVRYGMPPDVRAIDKIAIKATPTATPKSPLSRTNTMPDSSSSYPRGNAAYSVVSDASLSMSRSNTMDLRNGGARRESTDSVLSRSQNEGQEAREPYIVEVGSQDKHIRILRIGDISEQPKAEEREARKAQIEAERVRERENEEAEEEEEEGEGGKGERRPLLQGVKRFFSSVNGR